MTLILNETRHLELSNHIHYTAIGLVLSEIYFFEVYPRFLPLDLTKVAYVGHNSPYTTSNLVQLILLEILHIQQHINFRVKFDPLMRLRQVYRVVQVMK